MIRIVHISSGEHVITKLAEIVDKNGEPLCFKFIMPMNLTLIPGEKILRLISCRGVLSLRRRNTK